MGSRLATCVFTGLLWTCSKSAKNGGALHFHLSMTVQIFRQRECNYRHLQETIALLPAATRELDANAQPDTLRALNAMTAAVTGANPQLFFAVGEVDGMTAGFISGAVAPFLLEGRTLAQDILLYVAPEYRRSGVATTLIEAFVAWGREHGASEVRLCLMSAAGESDLIATTEKLGFTKAGTVMTWKKAEP